jgi:GlpG protein
MRQTGTISDLQQANKFADYLLTLGIRCRVEPDQDCWAIWVLDEDQLQQGQEQLKQFLADPNAERFRGVTKKADTIRRTEEKHEKEYAKNVVDMSSRWRAARNTPLTKVVLALMFLATLASWFGDYEPVASWLYIAPFEQLPDMRIEWQGLNAVSSGQVWRLVTPTLMHGDWIHLIFGLWMYYHFASQIETRQGWLRLLMLMLVIAVISDLAEYVLADPRQWRTAGIIRPSPAFLGMSGVIYGLFGYAWIQSRCIPASGLFVSQQTVVILIGWAILCLVGVIGGIANIAHFAGLFVGMALGYAPVLWRQSRKK